MMIGRLLLGAPVVSLLIGCPGFGGIVDPSDGDSPKFVTVGSWCDRGRGDTGARCPLTPWLHKGKYYFRAGFSDKGEGVLKVYKRGLVFMRLEALYKVSNAHFCTNDPPLRATGGVPDAIEDLLAPFPQILFLLEDFANNFWQPASVCAELTRVRAGEEAAEEIETVRFGECEPGNTYVCDVETGEAVQPGGEVKGLCLFRPSEGGSGLEDDPDDAVKWLGTAPDWFDGQLPEFVEETGNAPVFRGDGGTFVIAYLLACPQIENSNP